MVLGENIMAVVVTKESATSTQVFFPGTKKEIWYKVENNGSWSLYIGGSTINIPVDISSVS